VVLRRSQSCIQDSCSDDMSDGAVDDEELFDEDALDQRSVALEVETGFHHARVTKRHLKYQTLQPEVTFKIISLKIIFIRFHIHTFPRGY